jgi:hypothetical protein
LNKGLFASGGIFLASNVKAAKLCLANARNDRLEKKLGCVQSAAVIPDWIKLDGHA